MLDLERRLIEAQAAMAAPPQPPAALSEPLANANPADRPNP